MQIMPRSGRVLTRAQIRKATLRTHVLSKTISRFLEFQGEKKRERRNQDKDICEILKFIW
jgi:hypothetical protein